MLIQVDAYPEGKHDKPSTTLHTCMSTCANESHGAAATQLIRIGRKAGHIVFPSDKTVSRQHCALQLVQLDASSPGAVEPRNDEETDACERSELGMCVVLENQGKGGSYVAVVDKGNDDEDDEDADQANSDDDSNSDTDDEAISQPKKVSNKSTSPLDDLPPCTLITTKLWNSTKPAVKLHKLDVGESFILPLEAYHADPDLPNTLLVQCGRSESTIGITWIPMRIAFSRILKLKIPDLKAQLPLIGGIPVPRDIPTIPFTTHLVTSELIGGAKQITAWNYRLPTVSTDYLQALLDRKACTDAMPKPEDFPPLRISKGKFWDDQANGRLLRQFTMLSFKDDDMEELARSSGANIVKLHEMTDKDALAHVQDLVSSSPNARTTSTIYFMLSSRKNLAKWLEKLGISQVTVTSVAKSIGEQRSQLKDSKGGLLGQANGGDDDDEEDDSQKIKAEDDEPPAPIEADSSDTEDESGPPVKPPPTNNTSKKSAVEEVSEIDVEAIAETKTKEEPDQDMDVEESEAEDKPASPSPQTIPKVESPQTTTTKRGQSQSQTQRRGTRKRGADAIEVTAPVESSPPKKDSDVSVLSIPTASKDDDAAMSTPDKETSTPTSHSDALPKHKSSSQQSKQVEPPSRKRQKAPTSASSSSGWLTIAPKSDKERKQLRQKAAKEYAAENGGFEFQPSAVTEQVMVSLRVPPPPENPESTNGQENVPVSDSSNAYSGPNFSKFRKNFVPSVPSRTRIKMKEVLPKESKFQQELDRQQQELVEQQKLADELFRDTGNGPRTVKRRRR